MKFIILAIIIFISGFEIYFYKGSVFCDYSTCSASRNKRSWMIEYGRRNGVLVFISFNSEKGNTVHTIVKPTHISVGFKKCYYANIPGSDERIKVFGETCLIEKKGSKIITSKCKISEKTFDKYLDDADSVYGIEGLCDYLKKDKSK